MSRLSMLRRGVLPVLFAVWALPVQPASAVLFEAGAGSCIVSGATPVACPVFLETFTAPFAGSSTGFARAAPGDLGASGTASLSTDNVAVAGSGTFVRGGGGGAQSRFDDFFVTGPATADGFVATTFNFVLDGSFFAAAAAVGSSTIGAEAIARTRLDIIAISHTIVPFGAVISDDGDGLIICEEAGGCDIQNTIGSAFGEIGASDGSGTLTVDPFLARGLIAEGMFSGATISDTDIRGTIGLGAGVGGQVNGVFATPEFMLPIGQKFELIIQFQTGAGVGVKSSGSGQGNAVALIDFSQSLEFPSDGPFINLPAGYTVDSLGARIADNRWTGGTAQPPVVVAVPEPPTLPLLAFGMLALVAFSRARGATGAGSNGRLNRATAA